MTYVFNNVRTIYSAVKEITGFVGLNDSAYLLIAKGIIRGSEEFEEVAELFKKGSVVAKRAEALFLEQRLQRINRDLQGTRPRDLAKQVLPNRELIELIESFEDGREYKSSILPPAINYLRNQDYLRNGLLTIGENIAMMGGDGSNSSPEPRVDIRKLGTRKPPQTIKRLYHEFTKIQRMIQGLQ